MKIAVISDIHSNIVAFRACMEYLEKLDCEEYLFLGDYVSDTPYTTETMAYLYEFTKNHSCRMLRGNREEYMLAQRRVLAEDVRKEKWSYNSASGNLKFTYEQLTEKDLDYFEALPISFRFEKEGYPAMICCHGSPASSRELLQIDGHNTKEWLGKIDADYLICAHTHLPGQMDCGEKHYFNPGCVGISINDPGFAQCMVLESVNIAGRIEWQPEFLKIPYDNKRVVRDMFTGGMLEKAPWFINSNIQTLLTGEDNSSKMVDLAKQLAQEAGETDVWPNVKEKYFEEAASRLGIPDYREKGEDL